MGQITFPPFVGFVNSQSWAANQVLARNPSNTGFAWMTPGASSPATPSGAVQVCGFGSSSTSFVAAPGFSSDSFGAVAIAPNARSSASGPWSLKITPPADTTLAAGVNAPNFLTVGAARQYATGAISTYNSNQFGADTISAVGDSVLTTGATVYIAGPPVAGPHVTITNPYALQVASGNSQFAGTVNITSTNKLAFPDIAILEPTDSQGAGAFSAVAFQPTTGNKAGVFRVAPSGSGSVSVFEVYYGSGFSASQRAVFYVDSVKVNIGPDASLLPIQFIQNNISQANISAVGTFSVTPSARSSGNNQTLTVTPPNDTGIMAGANSPNVLVNGASRQWATGAVAATYSTQFGADTITAVGASVVTTAATVYIAGPPVADTNVTITNPYAVLIGGALGLEAAGVRKALIDGSGTFLTDFVDSPNGQHTLLSSINSGGLQFGISYINSDSGATYTGRAHTFVTNDGTILAIGNSFDSNPSAKITQNLASLTAVVVKGIASRAAPLLQLQSSAGASLGNVGGTIFDTYTTVSSSSTNGTFDTLGSDTIAANTLAVNGDKVVFDFTLTIVSSATATREIKLVFAGVGIFDSTALTFAAAGTCRLFGYVQRVTSTTCRSVVNFSPSGSSTILGDALTVYTSDATLTGLTLSGTNVLLLTAAAAGTGAAAADINLVLGTVSCIPSS